MIEILNKSRNQGQRNPTEIRCDNLQCGVSLEWPWEHLNIKVGGKRWRKFLFCSECAMEALGNGTDTE